MRGISETLTWATPLILAGLAVAIGFRAGLFNIGAEGQFYAGAVAATWMGIAGPSLPPWIGIPVVLLVLAITLHNVPEGLAVAMPLRREGMGRFKAFMYGQASGVVEMNCFLCHADRPDNDARVEELRAGRFAWAAT